MKASTVILAAGDFPKKDGVAWRLIAAAKRVVACDSAAVGYRRRFGKWPTAIVGDLDSLCARRVPCRNASQRAQDVPCRIIDQRAQDVPCRIILDADQETNDLEKALAFCAAEGWRSPVIVGATGKREDHTIGNVFRALEAQVPIITDHGVFHPVCGRKALRARKGAGVSVFAPDPATRMTSTGLQWPLAGVRFTSLYRATLNRATGARVTVTSDRPVFVFVEN